MCPCGAGAERLSAAGFDQACGSERLTNREIERFTRFDARTVLEVCRASDIEIKDALGDQSAGLGQVAGGIEIEGP